METITIKKQILLEKVKSNRDFHQQLAVKAKEGFRARAILEFQNQLQRAKAGKKFRLHLNLKEPEDHTDDYDRLIEMLELSADDLISLSEHDFSRYVRDEWDWKDDFENSVVDYVCN